jgi:hypothetical protein
MVLSMAGCANILLVDDELNILPTSSVTKAIEAVEVGEDGVAVGSTAAAASKELRALGESLSDTQVGCGLLWCIHLYTCGCCLPLPVVTVVAGPYTCASQPLPASKPAVGSTAMILCQPC